MAGELDAGDLEALLRLVSARPSLILELSTAPLSAVTLTPSLDGTRLVLGVIDTDPAAAVVSLEDADVRRLADALTTWLGRAL